MDQLQKFLFYSQPIFDVGYLQKNISHPVRISIKFYTSECSGFRVNSSILQRNVSIPYIIIESLYNAITELWVRFPFFLS